jgi:8-oxo-dGTP pyrophosphatase MutT (NUDIX family)
MVLIVRKVTALITRGEGADRQLLVFRHPDAGIQLPAGTVEPDESFEAAVLREACEETGLCDFTLVGLIGTLETDYSGTTRRVIPDEAGLRSAPNIDAPITTCYERGFIVTIGETQGDFIHVTHRVEFDWLTDPNPVTSGWLPAEAVPPCREVRHLFHLIPTSPTPDAWELISDGGRLFKCYWVKLADDPGLVAPQAEWLARVKKDLA